MTIAVLGANGGIGQRLLPLLSDAGHGIIGMVRSQDQLETMRSLGAEPRLGDLEDDFAEALTGADAVVFTAGSGGGTGWDKTLLVDLWGAKRAVDACEELGIDRFVMISSRGAADPQTSREPLRPYSVAKYFADHYLQHSSLDATILRPTRLTDAEGTGRVSSYFDATSGEGDPIPRADVAGAVVACLENEATIGHAILLYGGETPIEEALQPPA